MDEPKSWVDKPKRWVDSMTVRKRCGGVSDATLWRMLRDPALGFPQPVYRGGLRFWDEAELDRYAEREAVRSA